MKDYIQLEKILRKGKRISTPNTILEGLQKLIYEQYKAVVISNKNDTSLNNIKKLSSTLNDSDKQIKFPNKHVRDIYFLTLYYGLQGDSFTLDSIGKLSSPTLTRERVRQIIDSVIENLNINCSENICLLNPYKYTISLLNEYFKDKTFISFESLINIPEFKGFEKNIKGLISFLNDCNIKQISYRKNYYFYSASNELDKKTIVADIQKENKNIRRNETLNKMSSKSKTVTYVPNDVREFLLNYSNYKQLNLNYLYEIILTKFIDNKPYKCNEYEFTKTQSWKARKGKAEWKQIGIYIDKEIFLEVNQEIEKIKNTNFKNVSLMSFISQAFTWYCQKNQKNI